MLTKEEYEITKQRLDKGEKQLEEKWFNPKYKEYTDKWSTLLEQVLEYEIFNNIPREQQWGYR